MSKMPEITNFHTYAVIGFFSSFVGVWLALVFGMPPQYVYFIVWALISGGLGCLLMWLISVETKKPPEN